MTKSNPWLLALLVIVCVFLPRQVAADELPPGWLPVSLLDTEPTWREFREIEDRVHLYLPNGDKPVRGVFVCFVFHSSDPRELARLWNFALVTVPWPFEYDLGVNDKRNGRYQLGHDLGSMGNLLDYLDAASRATGHPELNSVPIVGWLGQNGSRLCADLYGRAPGRVIAWADSFPNALRQFPELTKAVPFAFAWEISGAELRNRERQYKTRDEAANDLSCRATTYGFGHGIYSKYNFFAAYLDRCIQRRLPQSMPTPGEAVTVESIDRQSGWIGDFDPVSEWNPIAVAGSADAANMKYPCWFPDEYTAWMWRAYHSANPKLRLSSPVVEYRKFGDKWGGPQCGLGYGGYLQSGDSHTFSATAAEEFVEVRFHDGNRILGTVTKTPWELSGVKLQPGLRAVFAVGVRANGEQSASRPAFVIVE